MAQKGLKNIFHHIMHIFKLVSLSGYRTKFAFVFIFVVAARRQEEGVSVPAAGVHGDRQQPQLEIQI